MILNVILDKYIPQQKKPIYKQDPIGHGWDNEI